MNRPASCVRRGGAVLALAAVLALSGCGSVPAADSPQVLAAVARFRTFAQQESLGEPFTVSYVVTTAKSAEAELYGESGQQDDGTPVVALEAVGRFSAVWESHPCCTAPAPGRYLTQVLPLDGSGARSVGLGDRGPDLAALGRVTVLP